MEKLAEFARTQPHAASAYVQGQQHKFLQTIPGMEKFLEPLDKVIDQKILPVLFGSDISKEE